MVKITFIDHQGTKRVIEAKPGQNIMEIAVQNLIPGIDADCGGACACATCHVYVDEAFLDQLSEKTAIEESMLDFAENVKPNSRLSCQLTVTEALNGIIVTTPESQG